MANCNFVACRRVLVWSCNNRQTYRLTLLPKLQVAISAGFSNLRAKLADELCKQQGSLRSAALAYATCTEYKRLGEGLSAFRPSNFNERRAAVKLQKLLAPEPLKKQRGRPGLTAQDRVQMHADAQQLKHEGMSTDEVVRASAQRYEVRLSYARRILEDASQSKRSR